MFCPEYFDKVHDNGNPQRELLVYRDMKSAFVTSLLSVHHTLSIKTED